jgi:hypothetical protein
VVEGISAAAAVSGDGAPLWDVARAELTGGVVAAAAAVVAVLIVLVVAVLRVSVS